MSPDGPQGGPHDLSHLLAPALAVLCCLPLLLYLRPQQIPPRGCHRIGFGKGQSNLHDEFDPKYSKGVPRIQRDGGEPSWRVKALFTYPIKSCGGIELQEADVVPTGLKFDRQFVFAEKDADGFTIRTLRNAGFQRLALIHPEIWIPDPSTPDYNPSLPEVKSRGVMIISYPRFTPQGLVGLFIWIGMAVGIVSAREIFHIPLHPPESAGASAYPLIPVKIWKDKPLAHDYGKHIPASLHKYLGFDPKTSPVTLFRASDSHVREIFRNAPRKEEIGFQPHTSFADAYPIHLLNLASHRDVASRCAYAIPKLSITRFRANIIIQGPEAFAEDHWKRIDIAGVEIYAACRTVRCRLPNVDPATGERHKAEPDRTLKASRRIDDGDRTNACLGMQLVPALKEFVLRVGDEVGVLETGEHRYIKMLAPGEKVEGV
ncbi:MOSC N-terminal beta barrel [Penicillium argentinense]|uniref:MOSC N-terminal beta barrel n=1 Tax=Penicillium argentinense TaxID=1131581 RepID=A0A9W9K7I5_9EURO|nr:MOSC N-terminal beta barrel [Penicillium argentinense]KAJ5095042.1 MOSC N-terminal beta barrel [Penicillium argentinense]